MNSEQFQNLYSVVDPQKKDAKWMTDCISNIRRWWRPLKSVDVMVRNKSIILSEQSMANIEAQFKDKQFKKITEFIPLGIWNRILNNFVEDLTKNPPKIEVKANDATALSDKQQDITRLKLKGIHENEINSVNQKIGFQPYVMSFQNFKSNVDEIQRMGLNPYDPEDIDFYEQNDHQRLKYEIAAQKLIDAVMQFNRFDEESIRDFVIDILASNCIAMQAYVDQMSGAILYKRLFPEEMYGIWGNTRDGRNDIATGYVTNITLNEWLRKVGNSFDFERDWVQLLWALNYANNQAFTGIIIGGNMYSVYDSRWNAPTEQMNLQNGDVSNVLNWNNAWGYMVYTGYLEFASPEITGEYKKRKKRDGQLDEVLEPYVGNKEESTEYEKETFYQEQMYKSYFIATSTTSQWIYNWGKVYYQQLEGACDEYARGTIFTYRLEGTSAAEISKYYVDLANLCAYRLKWMVYHAKPQTEQYIMSELVKVGKSLQKLYPQQGTGQSSPLNQNIIQQLIEFKRENMVDIRDYPEIDGKTYPNLPPQTAPPKGTDPTAIWLQAIEQWCEMQIIEKTGLNDVRLGQSMNPREGFKQNQLEMQGSLNNTGYVFRAVQAVKERICVATMNYSQDIVRFKDSTPYKWLLKLMGLEEFENLKQLDDFAAHRYGIFVRNYDSAMERQMLIGAANRALDSGDGRGGISIEQWGMIIGEPDYKKALKMLALYKYKADKKKHNQEIQMMQQQQQNNMELRNADAQKEQMKGQMAFQATKYEADAFMYSADKGYQGKVDTTQMKITEEPAKQQDRAQNQIAIAEHKKNIEYQEPLE